MDVTMLNDTLVSMSVLGDDDNLSTVTPILDRYRLDPDDNSIGIKVVPNRRGTHYRQSNQFTETIPETRTSLSHEYSSAREEFRSPIGLPGSVSARKKKYRKTPFPKKQVDDDSIQTWDENEDPNIQVEFASPKISSSSKTSTSISVPPLRPRSLELRRTLPKTPVSSRTHHSLPGGNSSSRTPLSDAFVAKHLPSTPRSEISKTLERESMTSNHLSSTPSERSKTFERESMASKLNISDQSFKNESARMGKWMEKITMAEYDRAPRVVQMQVRRDEANDALDALEDFLTSNLQQNNQTDLEFSEKEGYQVLGKLLGAEQKSKSVLMSLCHWRRLLMFRDHTHGMVFAVNQFEQ
jgi:hypothetical protein